MAWTPVQPETWLRPVAINPATDCSATQATDGGAGDGAGVAEAPGTGAGTTGADGEVQDARTMRVRAKKTDFTEGLLVVCLGTKNKLRVVVLADNQRGEGLCSPHQYRV